MGLGAVVAVLVLALFGTGVRTDALFAAYATYALMVSMAQGLRVSLVARLLDSAGWRPLDRFVVAAATLSAVALLPLVVLGGATARLLVGDLGDEAVDTARACLAAFWAAGSLQLLAGVAAAALSARNDHAPPAVGYLLGTLTAIGGIVVLASPVGVLAVPVAVLLGSLVVAVLLVARLASLGWRWRPARLAGRSLAQLLGGTVHQLTLQLAYVVSLAYAARLGPGEVTTYSYAFFAALLLLGATAGPASIVLAGPLAETWDRRRRSLEAPMTSVAQLSFLLAAPALALAALVGPDLLRAGLGSSLASSTASSITVVLLWLSVFVVATAAGSVPVIACFALGRYRQVCCVSAVALLVHVVLSASALTTGRLVSLAAATSTTAVIMLVGLLVVVFGRGVGRPLVLLGRGLGVVLLAIACALLPAVLVRLAWPGPPGLLAAPLLMLAIYAGAARVLLPSSSATLGRLVAGAVGRP
jgi:O-antigen/teichoic acid export membrane protein